MHETFWDLLRDPAHWQFLMFLFDVVIGLILFPFFKKWVLHHKTDDQKLDEVQEQVRTLQRKIKRLAHRPRRHCFRR